MLLADVEGASALFTPSSCGFRHLAAAGLRVSFGTRGATGRRSKDVVVLPGDEKKTLYVWI